MRVLRVRSVRWPVALVAVLLVTVAACGDDGGAEPTAPPPEATGADGDGRAESEDVEPAADDGDSWPVPDWEPVEPEEAGFDPDALEEMAEQAEAAGSSCFVITRDGHLVAEWNWGDREPDDLREAFSVTKSITSTLVGIAQDQGLLDIDDPASDFIEEWQGTPSEDVTIRNLISNDSGRFWEFNNDFGALPGSEDQTAFAIGLEQQHEPGTQWDYNNSAIQTLDEVLEQATGTPTREFAQEVLFEPIGMESDIATDPAGNTLTYMGAQTNCRDLARFGLLFLREGEWDGEQVVSRDFVREAISPSQELNEGYGFLWWLHDDGTYAAQGLNDQVVAVFPSDGVVATRMSGEQGEEGVTFGGGEIRSQVPDALVEE
jgi:CubicO group peptidase (beta-lactamase class C family)